MIYFSDIRRKKVFTEDNVYVGRLDDLIFEVSDIPNVTKLVVRNVRNDQIIVPVENLKKINKHIYIHKSFVNGTIEENELFILRNLLDKQIIDIKGNKIVRVNDIAIQDKPILSIAGADIGVLGILRRLGVEKFIISLLHFLKIKITSDFLSWGDVHPLELSRGHVKLRRVEEKLEKIRPEDLADHLERTNIINVRKILSILKEGKAAEVIGNLNINYQTSLFKHFHSEKAAKIISVLDPDEAVDILLTLNLAKREEILSHLEPGLKKELNYLLNLSRTPIGDILTTEYLTVESDNLVREVINKIKKDTSDYTFLNGVYVVNKDGQLTGVFNLHELLLQDLETPVYKFMVQNVAVIHLTSPEEIVLKKMIKYRIDSVPVIDDDKHILGIVTFDDISRFILNKI